MSTHTISSRGLGRKAAAVLLGVAVLAASELVFRLFHLAPSTAEVILKSGRPPAGYPYFKKKKGRGRTICELSPAYYGKTNPVSFELPKPSNTAFFH